MWRLTGRKGTKKAAPGGAAWIWGRGGCHDPAGMDSPWRNPSIWGERTSPPMTVFR